MCDFKYVTVPDEILEELRCSICTQYLSCTPIKVLPNRKSVCDKCRTSGYAAIAHTSSTLNTLLSKLHFPCKNKGNGCKKRLLPEEANNHSGICNYQGFPCPILECTCKEPILLHAHFSANHRHLVLLREAKFNVDVDEDKEAIIMVVVDAVEFMLKYKYNAAARELCYDVRYLKSVKAVSCKIQILNSSDHDYNICMKANACQPYDYSFNNLEISNTLVLSNIFPLLNEPSQVNVVMILTVTKDTETDLLTCTRCKSFLSIPFFQNNGATICSKCHEAWVPRSNSSLVVHVANSLIPCRYCGIMQLGSKIQTHEESCEPPMPKKMYFG